MNLLTISLRNFMNRRIRTTLTLLGVGVAISTFVALTGLTDNFKDSMRNTYKSRATDIIILEGGTVDLFSTTIDESLVNEIRKIEGVNDATMILADLYSFKFKQYTLIYGWPLDSYLFNELKVNGSMPKNPDEVIIGNMASRKLSKKIGDSINIRRKKFKVVGVFQSHSVLEEGSVIMDLKRLQDLKRIPGRVSLIFVKTSLNQKNTSQDIAVVRERIQNAFVNLEVKDISDFVGTHTPLLLVSNFTWGISIISFIIVILGIANTMMTSIFERRREIGILLAIGWQKSRIVSLILIESVFLGLIGGILGVVIGYVILNSLVATPQLEGMLSISYSSIFILRVIFIALILGIFSGIYPALRAVRIEPIEILRYE